MPLGNYKAGRSYPFQSTPAITGGRCNNGCNATGTQTRFNPRPPSLAGDAAVASRWRQGLEVSIHARHHWRAMHGQPYTYAAGLWFQSTPAITGGRCANAHPLCAPISCFNPRPPSLAGDAWVRDALTKAKEFQSTPAITGGRCGWLLRRLSRFPCFNPRPPSLAGDAVRQAATALHQRVSIHARHHWRAMRLAAKPLTPMTFFTIAREPTHRSTAATKEFSLEIGNVI